MATATIATDAGGVQVRSALPGLSRPATGGGFFKGMNYVEFSSPRPEKTCRISPRFLFHY
jgi:hypothetical protein